MDTLCVKTGQPRQASSGKGSAGLQRAARGRHCGGPKWSRNPSQEGEEEATYYEYDDAEDQIVAGLEEEADAQ